jgi:hypothetical protein
MSIVRPSGQSTNVAFSPDGKYLVFAGPDAVVRFFDTTTGKERTKLKGHQAAVLDLAFAANGKVLASASSDTTALVWEVPAVEDEKAPVEQLEEKQLEALWDELKNEDAARAYQAIRTLRQVPRQAVPLLKGLVQATPPPDEKKVTQLIADLDGEAFVTRKKAEEELEKMGELAQDAIQKALNARPSLEVQKRLEGLLAKVVTGATLPPHQLRTVRAMEILESIGTPEAQEAIKIVAKGAAGARVTRDAQAALDRLSKR